MTPRSALIPIALLGALTAACATQPQPTEELTRARAVVQQADKTNAQRYAAADLQRAHDELSNAEKSNEEKKYDEARRYAQSAEADADVATARASAGEAQRAAHEVVEGNQTLREESERHAVGSGPESPPPPQAALPPPPPASAAESAPAAAPQFNSAPN